MNLMNFNIMQVCSTLVRDIRNGPKYSSCMSQGAQNYSQEEPTTISGDSFVDRKQNYDHLRYFLELEISKEERRKTGHCWARL